MPSEIAIPFRVNPDGQIAVESNPDRQVRQHVMSLVNTEPGERVVITEYGIPLNEAVFEEGDEDVIAVLSDTIDSAMATWEPGVILRAVGADPKGIHQAGDGLSQIRVEYARGDSPTTSTSGPQTNVATIKVGGEVSEVVRG